ncbi:MAG TPA: chromosomal replication initiator protein DnaA [Accumulibacter sp.]|uniref:chromosomal replication initiator protein DnaA n=1 Tax=Accumulibacter sp. TaxID=2053492 RepID=UPI0025F2C809|nr:chromosomal replication initiator protein DnaA [Accumulibacter sp.]MCM8597555.1 chromosomal replication initiator protein DnaA [Accumulibacter sp.]MCM8663540.1 chromosomal replication initiator protein DnaA [Accumulibacter sp.]HNF92149.1 chromosomal replication initiator protein DnaA [Accumulibacter sp.]
MCSFWVSCLSQFEQELPPQQFNTWIRPLRCEGEDDVAHGLRLLAPNGFILKWVKERYLARVEALASEYFSTPVNVALSIAERAAATRVETAPTSEKAPSTSLGALAAVGSASRKISPSDRDRGSYEKTRLIAGFTFENLVVGKANDLARAAARQVALSPGGASYNPLFIYGGAGLGKTHLIHAIGNQILEHDPDKIVRYVHAEDYYSDVVRAYQKKSFDVFKRYYRSLDVLLLDDVHFFNGKNRTQEEFFFVFNALSEAKKQIVISSDTYPKNISGLEDRLITRFDWGLTVQIEPPETEMRVAILKKKAEAEGVALDDEVAFYIAKHLRSNVRELEGALKKVLAYSAFHGQQIALDLAKEALKDVIGSVNRQITVDSIQKTVAEYFKMKVADLFSKKRTRVIVRPRQIAMWLAKDLTSLSYPAIGDAFGGRDHTTVLHAVRTIDELRTRDNELNHDVHVLLQVLKG